MASYVLFVTGNYGLSHRIFSTLKDAAKVVGDASDSNPLEFTIQCFDRDGRFSRAFGGTANKEEARNVQYNGWTSGNRNVKADMRRLEKYLTSV